MALHPPKVSTKVDLTSHRDFAGSFDIENILINSSSIELFRNLSENEFVSHDEYILIKRFEKFFGKKFIHKNQANEIFDKDGKFEADMRCHCQRCGKLLRIPWKRKYDLCLECNTELENDDKIIPWKEIKILSNNGRGNDDRDILNLR